MPQFPTTSRIQILIEPDTTRRFLFYSNLLPLVFSRPGKQAAGLLGANFQLLPFPSRCCPGGYWPRNLNWEPSTPDRGISATYHSGGVSGSKRSSSGRCGQTQSGTGSVGLSGGLTPGHGHEQDTEDVEYHPTEDGEDDYLADHHSAVIKMLMRWAI